MRVHDALCTLFEGSFELGGVNCQIQRSRSAPYQRNDVCRLTREFMGQFLIVGDKMRDIDIAEVLLHEHILPYLIPAAAISWASITFLRRALYL